MITLHVVARGTAANLLRGVAPALLTGLLPIILVPLLPSSEYSAWSLAVSLAAWVPIFSLNVQAAVTSIAAQKPSDGNFDSVGLQLVAAFEFISPLMSAAYAAAILVSLFSPSLFPGIPTGLGSQFRAALLILCATAILNTLSSVIWAYAIAIDRLRLTLVSSLAGRVGAFGAAVVAALCTHDIAVVAAAFCAPVLLSLPMQLFGVRIQRRAFAPMFHRARRRYRSRYRHAARTLGVLSIGTLMISGLDGTIVGRFDYVHTGVYIFVGSIVTLLIAASSAWMPSYLARAPRLDNLPEQRRVRRAARLSTAFNIQIAAISAIPTWVLLTVLFEAPEARLGYCVFIVLMAANTIRHWDLPPVLSSIAGEHYQRLLGTSLAEAAINLALSIFMCLRFGALGVAIGTLGGAILTIPVVLLYTFRDHQWTMLDRNHYAADALLRPLTVLGFPAAAAMTTPLWAKSLFVSVPIQLVFCLLAGGLGWRWLLRAGERVTARSVLARGMR